MHDLYYPEFGTGLIVTDSACDYMLSKLYNEYVTGKKLDRSEYTFQDFKDRNDFQHMLDAKEASYYDGSRSGSVQLKYFETDDYDFISNPVILCWSSKGPEMFEKSYSNIDELADEMSAKFGKYLPEGYSVKKHLGELRTVIF